MRELVESILTGNNVEAHRLFESRLNEIREKKLYEAKRNLAAQMDEVLGGLTKAEIADRVKRGFVKASKVLKDPRDIKISLKAKQKAQSQQPTGDADLRKTFGVEKPGDKKRPGVIRRNVNTLMGREAGYTEPEKSPEEKEMQRGGRVGKGLRMAGKGVGKAWGTWGNIVRSGMSGPLE